MEQEAQGLFGWNIWQMTIIPLFDPLSLFVSFLNHRLPPSLLCVKKCMGLADDTWF